MKQMANRRRHLPIGSRYVLHGVVLLLVKDGKYSHYVALRMQ